MILKLYVPSLNRTYHTIFFNFTNKTLYVNHYSQPSPKNWRTEIQKTIRAPTDKINDKTIFFKINERKRP